MGTTKAGGDLHMNVFIILLYVIGGLCILMILLDESDRVKWFSIKSEVLKIIIAIIAVILIIVDGVLGSILFNLLFDI